MYEIFYQKKKDMYEITSPLTYIQIQNINYNKLVRYMSGKMFTSLRFERNPIYIGFRRYFFIIFFIKKKERKSYPFSLPTCIYT